MAIVFYIAGDHRDLHVLTHSFPTRRSSDLVRCTRRTLVHAERAGFRKDDRVAVTGRDGRRRRGHRDRDAGARGPVPAPGPPRGERGMNVARLAMQEIRAGLRNRWVVATTLLLAALSLSLALLGSAPTGVVQADPLAVVVVSLPSLTQIGRATGREKGCQ